ncbi:hypothetical protein [Embleya sp. NPDC001921]
MYARMSGIGQWHCGQRPFMNGDFIVNRAGRFIVVGVMAAAFVVGGSSGAFANGTGNDTPPAQTDGTRVTNTDSAATGTDNREY